MTFYKTRNEAVNVRKNKDMIYFVANKGYYLVSKKPKLKELLRDSNFQTGVSVGLIVMGIIASIIKIIL